jgi:hypothetical protein
MTTLEDLKKRTRDSEDELNEAIRKLRETIAASPFGFWSARVSYGREMANMMFPMTKNGTRTIAKNYRELKAKARPVPCKWDPSVDEAETSTTTSCKSWADVVKGETAQTELKAKVRRKSFQRDPFEEAETHTTTCCKSWADIGKG